MAKWGEGDPRWIVEERPDATNVNNWHWTEKNASQWSKDKLKELLVGLEVKNELGSCRITEMTKIEGEASANNRKAKLIFFYEWVIKLEWKGTANGGDGEEIKGKIDIPNLSEENEANDIDISVGVKSSSKEANQLKNLMRTEGAATIRERLSQYVKDLKEGFVGYLTNEKKKDKVNDVNPTNRETVTLKTTQTNARSSETTTSKMNKLDIAGKNVETAKLEQKENFKCTAVDLYNALTIKEMVQAFTRGSCTLEAKVGGSFLLFDGNVSGKFLKLEPNKKLEMTWRFSGWPSGHYSTVTLDLEQKEDCTTISLTQKGVPASDLERTRMGWSQYYWESMKKTFGFGAMLF